MDDPSRTPSESEARPWRSLEEREEAGAARAAAAREFAPGASEPPTGLSRRQFLELAGATTLAASTAACSPSGRGGIVPYTRRPPEVVPGVANYYASTFQEGARAYGVLVKTREGRPVHITGNDEHPVLKGKTSPRAVADVLRLYDPDRLRGPRLDGREASWDAALGRIAPALAAAKASGAPVLLLTGALESPSRKALVAELGRALPSLRHLAWEPASAAGREAAATAFGGAVNLVPDIRKAKVILSFGDDFLSGGDPAAIEAFAAMRRLRSPKEPMNRLWVIEGAMTLTGAKADHRFPLRPSQAARTAFALARALRDRHGVPLPAGVDLSAIDERPAPGIPAGAWDALLADLKGAGREALVLCGDGMPMEAHHAAHLLNAMLRTEALAFRPAEPLAAFRDLEQAAQAMAAGGHAAVLLWGVNPAYAFPKPDAWAAAMAKVPLRAWIGLQEDESAAQCQVLMPEHHWLEAWGDHDGGEGLLTLQQPAIGPLYDTRQGEDVLLELLRRLGGAAPEDYHAYLRARWSREVQPAASPVPFERYFEVALHDGVVPVASSPAHPPSLDSAPVNASARRAGAAPGGDFELVTFPGLGVHDGRYGNNAWIQEWPDPVTKSTWGNPLSLSVADAGRLDLKDGDMALLTAGGATVVAPVLVQPGQAAGVLVLALGYGRTVGRVAKGVGLNGYPLTDPASPGLRPGVRLAKSRGHQELPVTQGHNRMEGRDLVHSFSLAEYAKEAARHRQAGHPESLYPDQTFPDHKWGMTIDLSACVGCSACVLACQSENNVPVVGAEQVVRGREMHWIRIDRYYVGRPEKPGVVLQPMLCQQCDDAPCENVCPGERHQPQPRRPQPDGLQPLRGHPLLRQQLPVQGAPVQFSGIHRLPEGAAIPGLQPRSHGPAPGGHGEVHLLHPAHPGRQGARQGRAPARARRRDRPRLRRRLPCPGHRLRRPQGSREPGLGAHRQRPRIQGAGGTRHPAGHHLPGQPEESRHRGGGP